MWPADLEADASRLEAGAVSPGLMVFAGTAVAVLEQAPKIAASRVPRESHGEAGIFSPVSQTLLWQSSGRQNHVP